MRRCPRCRVPMQARKVQFAEVDFCPDCGGAFFDPGEAMAVHSASAEPSWLIEDGKARRIGPSTLRCPAHARAIDGDDRGQQAVDDEAPAMTVYHVGDGPSPVEIDYCEACGGAFLDFGEGAQLTDTVLSMERALLEGATGARFVAPPQAAGERVVAEARAKQGKSFFGELMRGVLDAAIRYERDARIVRRSGGPSGPFSPYGD
ncbi:MAG TPA: zf-TFIIB domain-containing protein [Sandaracinaceae bacterium]